MDPLRGAGGTQTAAGSRYSDEPAIGNFYIGCPRMSEETEFFVLKVNQCPSGFLLGCLYRVLYYCTILMIKSFGTLLPSLLIQFKLTYAMKCS